MLRGGCIHSNFEYSIPIRTQCEVIFSDVVAKENLYHAWNDFIRGKRKRHDVSIFAARLADNLDTLHHELISDTYTHGSYEEYVICDPKKRIIHKASVRDRIVHRLLYNALYSYFDRRFIHDSYSCRIGKGTHKARAQFRIYANTVSQNYTKPCFILKFDIKKCFESIDQGVLRHLLSAYIEDKNILNLIVSIIDSFTKGLPLGNLTSQLFINIYLHELDYVVKQKINVTYYIRYADDVVVLSDDRQELVLIFWHVNLFLKQTLKLIVHKISISSLYGGVDMLGEVFFPKYKRLRRSTERRMRRRDCEGLKKSASRDDVILIMGAGDVTQVATKLIS